VAAILNGTPFKSTVSRLLGLRLGKRVFDDGSVISERTLVAIGDYCTINQGSVIQCHSLEDGAFKSDRTVVSARCTLGVGTFIHYGATVDNGAELAAGSFLMKGAEIPAGERWGGNPARQMTDHEVISAGRPAGGPMPAPPGTTPAPGTTGRHRQSTPKRSQSRCSGRTVTRS
jgi:hypothetical protein